jgi:hypothetical protein
MIIYALLPQISTTLISCFPCGTTDIRLLVPRFTAILRRQDQTGDLFPGLESARSAWKHRSHNISLGCTPVLFSEEALPGPIDYMNGPLGKLIKVIHFILQRLLGFRASNVSMLLLVDYSCKMRRAGFSRSSTALPRSHWLLSLHLCGSCGARLSHRTYSLSKLLSWNFFRQCGCRWRISSGIESTFFWVPFRYCIYPIEGTTTFGLAAKSCAYQSGKDPLRIEVIFHRI